MEGWYLQKQAALYSEHHSLLSLSLKYSCDEKTGLGRARKAALGG